MRTKIILAILAAFCLFAGASATTTNITSLPYTASQAGTNYSETLTVNGTMLSSTGNGINFTGHDIVLVLLDDTVRFGTDGGNSYYGLQFYSAAHHIRVEGGLIKHGTGDDMAVSGCLGIKFYGAPHDITIHDTDVKVSGTNAHCIDSYGQGTGIYNIDIDGGRYWDFSHDYTSRCAYDGAVIRLENANSNGSYSAKIHDLYIMQGSGQGIVVCGRSTSYGRYQIYACSISTDHRNTMYSSPGNACYSSGNPYGIHTRFVGAGTTIHDNTIRSGATYGGNRGLILENAHGSSSNYITVYNNDVDVHEGPNVNDGEFFNAFAMRIRSGDGGVVGYLYIHDNTFVISGDTLDTTDNYGAQPVAMNYTNDLAGQGTIRVENNLFRAYDHGGTGGVVSKGLIFDYASGDTTFVFHNNRLESDKYIIKWGDYNGGGWDLRLDGDTLKFYGTAQSGAATYYMGESSNAWDNSANSVIDMVYEGGASDTNIIFSSGGTSDLHVRRTLRPYVKGSNDLPIDGAVVTFTDAYSHQFSDTTDATGYAQKTLTYWFESRTATDSIAYNDFTIKAKKGTDSTSTAYTVTATSTGPTLTLGETGGEPPPPNPTNLRWIPKWIVK